MLALAGIPLGLRFRFLDPHESPCAAELGEHIRGEFDDEHAIARFTDGLDIATIEFENIPPHALEIASRTVPVLPSALSLGIAKDRVKEKELFDRCGIQYAPTATISGIEDTSVQALAKIEQMLPNRLRRRVSALHASVVSLRRAHGDDEVVDPDALSVLASACRDHEEARFHYQRPDGDSSRRLVLILCHPKHKVLWWDSLHHHRHCIHIPVFKCNLCPIQFRHVTRFIQKTQCWFERRCLYYFGYFLC